MSRRAATLIGVVFAATVPLSVAQPARAAVPEAVIQGGTPQTLSALASCISARRGLDMLVMFDTSSSLTTTDSSDQRKTAAEVAVNGLKQLADNTGGSFTPGPVRVSVAVARFAGDFQAGDWHDLATDSDAVSADINGVASRQDGQATDYVVAMRGAQTVLAARAADETRQGGHTAACQALIWFTDGGYEPGGYPATDPQWAFGTAALCGPGNTVDQLRSDGVTVITIPLTGEIPARGVQLLEGVTSDPTQPPEQPCGSDPGAQAGEYLPATNANELVGQFAAMAAMRQSQVRCAGGQACVFVLPPELRGFYAVIQTSNHDETLNLVPPQGNPVTLSQPGTPTAVQSSGASLRWAWINNQTVAVTGMLAPGSVGQWQGTWQVLAVGNGTVTGQVFLFGDLSEQIVKGSASFQAGKPWRFEAETVTSTGPPSVRQLATLRSSVQVLITDGVQRMAAQVTPVPGDPDLSDVHFTAPPDWHSSVVDVTVALRMVTDSGVDISPPPLTQSFAVTTPLTLRPMTLTAPSVSGRGSTTTQFTVLAGDNGGCVWLGNGGVRLLTALPVPVGTSTTLSTGSPNDCVPIGPHQQRAFFVTFTVGHGWSGTAHADIPVEQSVHDGSTTLVDLPVSFSLDPNPSGRALAVVSLVIFLLTVSPFAVGLLITRLGVRRFYRPRLTRVLRYDAVVEWTSDVPTIRPDIGDWEAWLAPDQLSSPDGMSVRRLRCGTVTFHAASSAWNPFDTPRTRVTAAAGHVVAADVAGPAAMLDGLPLRLPGTVVLSADIERSRDEFTIEVVALLAGELTNAEAARIRAAAKQAATRLRPATDPTSLATEPYA